MDNNYNNQNMQPYPNNNQQPMMGQPMMGQGMPQQGMAQSVIPQPGGYDTQAAMPQMAPQQAYINNAPVYPNQQVQQNYYQPPLVESAPAPTSAPKKSNKMLFIILGAVVGLIVLGFVIFFIMGMSSAAGTIDKARQSAYVDTANQYAKGAMNKMMLLGLDKYTDDSLLIFMPVGHDGNTCVQLESGGQSPYNATWKMAYVAFKYNSETGNFDYYFGGYDGSDTGIKFADVKDLNDESVEKNLKGYTQSLQDLYSGSLSLKKTAVSELEDDDLMEFAYTVGAQNIVVLSRSNCTK